MEKEKKSFIGKHKVQILIVALALVMIIGASYAWFTLVLNGNKEHTIKAGTLQLTLDDTSVAGDIAITDAVPLTDDDGKALDGYTFKLSNTGTLASGYKIYLDDAELEGGQTRLEDSFVKSYLTKEGVDVGGGPRILTALGSNPNRILDSGTIQPGGNITYVLKLWLDENAGNDAMNKNFKTALRIEAMQTSQIGG